MDEGPSATSTMMNTSGGSWLFGHTSFGSIHDATLGPPPPNPPTGNGAGGHAHGPSVSPFSSSPSAFDDRMSFSQNVSPTDISLAFDGSKHFVTSSSPHPHHQVLPGHWPASGFPSGRLKGHSGVKIRPFVPMISHQGAFNRISQTDHFCSG